MISLLSIIASSCVTGPPARVQINPGSISIEDNLRDETSPSLRITTFNVWGLPRWLNGAPSDRYHKIADQLDQSTADIVLLQEVWTRRCFADLSGQIKGSARNWWVAFARKKGTFLGQNGLLTLSRHPIKSAKVMHFSSAHLPDSLMHKGALKITIVVGSNQRFNIWNLHLQDGTSERVRSNQVSELIGWIRESQDGQIADIVGGDFNFIPGSPEFQRFASEVGPDVHALARDECFPTWDGLKPTEGTGQALDHIFVRMRQPADEIRADARRIFEEARREDRLSDHMGMQAFLGFERVTESPGSILIGQRAASLLETSSLTSR